MSNVKKGFTIIELLVVIALLGAMMTLAYQMLQSVWAEKFSSNKPLQIKQLLNFGRLKSLDTGSTLTLVLNFEERKMGIHYYKPELEAEQDEAIESLSKTNSQLSYRIQKLLQQKQDRSNLLKEKKIEIEWLVEPTNLPTTLLKVYSVGGSEIKNKKVYIHFYPNGTSDSVILEFNEAVAQKYLYLPRYNIPFVYIQSLDYNVNNIFNQYQTTKGELKPITNKK